MFEGGDDINGFLGYMLTRTPIGKRNDTDAANYWTIVLDTANFAGPAMYVSNYFWDMRTNWDPTSASWSDPRSLIGYIAQGFEGGVGSFATTSGSKTWRRTTEWGFPMDRNATTAAPSSTLFTGHSQYNTDWAVEGMEPMLGGTGGASTQTVAHVRAKAASKRTKPSCNLPNAEGSGKFSEEQRDPEAEWLYSLGFSLCPQTRPPRKLRQTRRTATPSLTLTRPSLTALQNLVGARGGGTCRGILQPPQALRAQFTQTPTFPPM